MASGISGFLHVAHEGLAFVDRHAGIAAPRRQVFDHIARGQAAPAPVPWHADVVDRLPGDAHHADTIRHEGLRANVSSWARYDHPVEIPDALLCRERLAHLDEQLGLELGEPR